MIPRPAAKGRPGRLRLRPLLNSKIKETRSPTERAIVAALLVDGTDTAAAMEPLAEITALAEAAGAEVLEGVVQRRRSAHPRYPRTHAIR